MSKYHPFGFAPYPAQNMRAPSLPASFTGWQAGNCPPHILRTPSQPCRLGRQEVGSKKRGKEILQLKKKKLYSSFKLLM
jgi:hypothetical protein